MTLRRKLPGNLAILIVTACACFATLAPSPDSRLRSAACLHDFLHVPGFGLVALVLWFGFPVREGAPTRRLVLHFLALFLVSVGVGIAVEIAQLVLGGDADIWDVGRDIAGAGGMVLVLGSLQRRTGAAWRSGLRLAALAGLLITLIPSARAIVDEVRAARQFPVLADFCASSDLDRFTWSAWSVGTFEHAVTPQACGALRLALKPGEYPGLCLAFFPRDWRGWRELSFTCVNPSATLLQVSVRIDDLWHNDEYQDRFNKTVLLTPGRNDVRILLADVESAPVGRKLDLGHVGSVMVFAVDLPDARSLIFREFRLIL